MKRKLSLTEDEIARVKEALVLTRSSYKLEQLLALPAELVTPDVVKPRVEMNAELFRLLPARLQTFDLLFCAMRAKNFRLSLCPPHMLDSVVCERYVSINGDVHGVPHDLLTPDMCELCTRTFFGTFSIPSHMITDRLVEASIRTAIHENHVSLLMRSDFEMSARAWRYVASNDNEISRTVLTTLFPFTYYEKSVWDCFYAGDVRSAADLMFGMHVENVRHVKQKWITLVLAAGELDELTQVAAAYLNAELAELKKLLENGGSVYMGPKIRDTLKEALECAHTL